MPNIKRIEPDNNMSHTSSPYSPDDELRRLAHEYAQAKEFADSAAERASWLKAKLAAAVKEKGVADHKGNLWLPVGNYELKHERRVSNILDTAGVEAWAKENGLWEQVSAITEHVSEEKLLTLAWERQDLAPLIQAFYSEKEVWAFKMSEGKTNRVEN